MALGFCMSALALAAPAPAAMGNYRLLQPASLAPRIEAELASPEAATADYWRHKPALARPSFDSPGLALSKADREAVAHLKRGEFTAYWDYPWKPLGVPPPWDANPTGSGTWDMYRHSLRWTWPLLRAYAAEKDVDSLRLVQRVIADWIDKNSSPPGPSPYSWHDHPTGLRLRTMCWFWELWRRSELFDPEFSRLVLASVYQHVAYLSDPTVYPADFNHGQDMDAALMVAAITFPEFREAEEWYRLAESRMLSYFARNFSPEGVHLEQSPYYHWYVIRKGANLVQYLRENGRQAPAGLAERIKQAAGVMYYLVKPNGEFPLVGDTSGGPGADWQEILGRLLGEPVAPAGSTAPNPRGDGASFFLSFPAGYAVFTSYPPDGSQRASDCYALFKCNAFDYPHAHKDALSFVLYGLGRDWLVDSGRYNYEEGTPRRRYFRSSRAHNVVLVDNLDFGFHPVRLVEWGRDERRDFVTATHELPQAVHTRSFEFFPPATIVITDTLESRDHKPHTYGQLFQVAPGLEVKRTAEGAVALLSPDGKACLISQEAGGGLWSAARGMETPYLQGWYSTAFNKLEPITTLLFSTPRPAERCVFRTRIVLLDQAAAASLRLVEARPPAVAAAGSQPGRAVRVSFEGPLGQYLSQWRHRVQRVVLKREKDGIRCEILGSAAPKGGQYGGITFEAAPFRSLTLELSFPIAAKIRRVYVDGYDARGRRVLRWEWQVRPGDLGKGRKVFVLRAGAAAGPFKPVPPSRPEAVRRVDVFVAIARGARAAFVLHRAEFVPMPMAEMPAVK